MTLVHSSHHLLVVDRGATAPSATAPPATARTATAPRAKQKKRAAPPHPTSNGK